MRTVKVGTFRLSFYSVDSFPHLTSPHPPRASAPSPLGKPSLNRCFRGESSPLSVILSGGRKPAVEPGGQFCASKIGISLRFFTNVRPARFFAPLKNDIAGRACILQWEKACGNRRLCEKSRALSLKFASRTASPRGEVSAETTERGFGRRCENRLF